MIYRDGPPVDPAQLQALFVAIGWGERDHAWLVAIVEGSRWVVTAWEGERLVGFTRALSDGIDNAYVSMVAVQPNDQGRGIGREMMHRLMAGRDHVKFVLHTQPGAKGLYRGCGFVDAPDMMVRERRG